MLSRPNPGLEDITNLICPANWVSMTLDYLKLEKGRQKWQESPVSMAFVIIITGLTEGEFSSVPSRKYLKVANQNFLSCYAGQMKTGQEYGMEVRMKFY